MVTAGLAQTSMQSNRNTSTAGAPAKAAIFPVMERLAGFIACGIILFFSLALISHALSNTTISAQQPSLGSLLLFYGGGYGAVLLYLRQRRFCLAMPCSSGRTAGINSSNNNISATKMSCNITNNWPLLDA